MLHSFHSHTYCRLCAELTSNNNIINVNSERSKQTIREKLDRINASTDFNDNILPKTLCRECAISLENACDFVLKIERAQRQLRSIFHLKRERSEEKQLDFTLEEEIKVEFDNDATGLEPMIEIDVQGDDIDVKEELSNVDDNDVENVSDDHPESDAEHPDGVNEQICTEVTDTAKNKRKVSKPEENAMSKRAVNKEIRLKSSTGQSWIDSKVHSWIDNTEQSWVDYTWKCGICEIEFNSFNNLKSHTIQHHKICNAFRCVDCNVRKLKLDIFLDHIKTHRKYLQVICFKCNERFPSAIAVDKHMASHRTGSEIIHTCPGCYTEFKNLTAFNNHTSEFYRERKRTQKSVSKMQINNLELERTAFVKQFTDKLTCLLCDKTFKSKSGLSSHVHTHTKEEKIKNHACDRCGKCFSVKSLLEEHIRRHDNVKPYECDVCNKSFVTKREVRLHMGVHGEKPFSCEECGRCFRVWRQLKSHKTIHTGSRPYACTVCDKRFRFWTVWNVHKRQHTGVRPFSCETCKRDFTNWSNYNKHMKRMHNLDMAKKKSQPKEQSLINSVTEETLSKTKEVLVTKKEIGD